MRLTSLSVRHFRNLAAVDLEPHPRFNILVGQNGQGKTNLLEAIYFLAALRSFRSFRLRDLIGHGHDEATVIGHVDRDGDQRDLSLRIRPTGRRIDVNGKLLRDTSRFFGSLNATVFAPEDTWVLRGSPSDRRTMLDRMVFHAKPTHGEVALRYDTTLRNRNALFRDDAPPDPALMAAYNAELAQTGAQLYHNRLAWLDQLQAPLHDAFCEIFGAPHEVAWRYEATWPDDIGHDPLPTPATLYNLEAWLLAGLQRASRREQQRGHTLVGPHRDDIVGVLDGQPMRVWASQGQHRAFVLALKIVEIQRLTDQFGHPPLLLLDDVSSELDPIRNARLFSFLDRIQGQVFLTTVDPAALGLRSAQSRYTMQNGQLLDVHSLQEPS